MDIEATAGSALARLAIRFRRHYFHLPYELAPDDLIAEGLVLNLDWDERDSLWFSSTRRSPSMRRSVGHR